MSRKPPTPRGRGALSLPDNRYEKETREIMPEAMGEAPPSSNDTVILPDTARSVLCENDSPDVGFSRSLNPYRGCEHGCIYCFARPTHAYLGLSPGLDFERRIFFKKDAAVLLEQELRKKSYRCEPIALGINTDSYQPAEEKLGVTRSILQVMLRARHPLTIVTKSALIERDLDLLTALSAHRCIQVFISLPTLNEDLSGKLEPRATRPMRRLETIGRLSDAGIPVGVLAAPVIPGLTDHELEKILESARKAGALSAGYILLRLPLEVRPLFLEWLSHHYPDSAKKVEHRLREFHGGALYDSEFGRRMRGSGLIMADLLSKRFEVAARRLGFGPMPELDPSGFVPPVPPPRRSRLFPDFSP